MKNKFLLAIILIVVGIIFVGVIFATTKTGKAVLNLSSINKIDFNDDENYDDDELAKTMTWNVDEIDSLEIEVDAFNVKVVRDFSEQFSVEVYLRKKFFVTEPKITTTNKTLKVIARRHADKKDFDFMFFKSHKRTEGTIVIKVPEKVLTEFDFIGGVGIFRIEDLQIERGKILSGASETEFYNCSCNDLDYKGGVGDISFEGALTGNCDLALGVGNAQLQLKGKKSDYRILVIGGLTNVSIDNKSPKLFDNNPDAPNVISAKVGLGSLVINFSERN